MIKTINNALKRETGELSLTADPHHNSVEDLDSDDLYTEAQVVELMENALPFNVYLGIKAHQFERGCITLRLEPKPEFIGDPVRPALHGGLIATLADTAAGMAVFSIIKRSCTTSTIDLRVDYLRPGAVDQALFARSKVIRQGRRVCVIHTTLYHEDIETPIAMSSATYSIIEARS